MSKDLCPNCHGSGERYYSASADYDRHELGPCHACYGTGFEQWAHPSKFKNSDLSLRMAIAAMNVPFGTMKRK